MINFKRSLSQNFLTDTNIKKKIMSKINIKNTDIIVEIGAGAGSISKEISTHSKKSHFIELDKTLLSKLKELTNNENSHIHNDDILRFNIKDLIKKYKKIRIIGNLPYKISTKIITTLTNFTKNIIDIHLIVQKEIAEKITTKNLKQNKLSIIVQNYFHSVKHFDIKPQSFYPVPKVTSSLISLKPKTKFIENKALKDFLNKAFNKKRKKLSSSIKIKKNETNLNLNTRPEKLTLDDIKKLCTNKTKLQKTKNLL